MAGASSGSSRLGLDPADYTAIAAGGVCGAALRWLITADHAPVADGGWFAYAPNTAVTLGRNAVVSGDTITVGDGPISLLPWDTLTVNLLGCFVLGAVLVALRGALGARRRALLGASLGFCGSLTTFSTFAVEVAGLLRGGPISPLPADLQGIDVQVDGGVGAALAYLALSVGGGAAVHLLGRRVGRGVMARSTTVLDDAGGGPC